MFPQINSAQGYISKKAPNSCPFYILHLDPSLYILKVLFIGDDDDDYCLLSRQFQI